MNWMIGCSGFHYREWKEVFYPPQLPQKNWFEYYASRFHTLELNTTFYRFPQLKTLEKWYDISPDSFIFSAKAPRLITHYKRFNDCESLLRDFYTTLEGGLRSKLGAVLFQFPPNMVYSEKQLKKITAGLSPSFLNVVEFRHPGWWNENVYAVLAKHGIVFSGASHPVLPDITVVNHPIVYYRFHGTPKIFYSAYTIKKLKVFADGLLQQKGINRVLVYFNNTASTAAIRNASWLQQYIEKSAATSAKARAARKRIR